MAWPGEELAGVPSQNSRYAGIKMAEEVCLEEEERREQAIDEGEVEVSRRTRQSGHTRQERESGLLQRSAPR